MVKFTYPCPFKVNELHNLVKRSKHQELTLLYSILPRSEEPDESDVSSDSYSDSSSSNSEDNISKKDADKSMTETDKSLDNERGHKPSRLTAQLKQKLQVMDNAESKLEFQKDCTEIIANIMGLFYLKKQEKIK